jgi:hypothetical protein
VEDATSMVFFFKYSLYGITLPLVPPSSDELNFFLSCSENRTLAVDSKCLYAKSISYLSSDFLRKA